MNQVKFSVFADLHHLPKIFYTEAPSRLEKICDRAIKNNVDFMIHLGDLSHEPHKYPDIIAQYEAFPFPTYHCIGNHECQGSTYEQVLGAFHMQNGYYFFDYNGFRFVVLDLNYMRLDGKAVHYDCNNYYERTKAQALVTFEEAQLAWFEQTVRSSPYPCIVFSHQSCVGNNSGFSMEELASLGELFEDLNRDKRRILMFLNGHHHRDDLRIFKNIAFFDLNSASYDWVDTPHAGLYPRELYEQYVLMSNTFVYEDPVHAIVTVREDGYIKIEGMTSRFLYDVDRSKAGILPYESDGIIRTPHVLSAELVLK